MFYDLPNGTDCKLVLSNRISLCILDMTAENGNAKRSSEQVTSFPPGGKAQWHAPNYQMSFTCNAGVFILGQLVISIRREPTEGWALGIKNRVLGCRSEFTYLTLRWPPDTRARISGARPAKPPALRAKWSILYRHGAASLLLSSYYWSISRWVRSSSFWGVWWLNDLPVHLST